jgi:hypothetical protein
MDGDDGTDAGAEGSSLDRSSAVLAPFATRKAYTSGSVVTSRAVTLRALGLFYTV